ncbi:FkbM family methyltransferase [Chitinibacter sp. SCUT-21]|uniref:FkbM family methyltransferase n=1 Tax=Chitinibacter sp. SCUT-21 TaxID=2970891 RepID=UPI0035A6575F
MTNKNFDFLKNVSLSCRRVSIAKASASDFLGRFRDIVSDPLNAYINRHPRAGLQFGDFVFLHNGLKVKLRGDFSYYDSFSDILIINSGVHEPLEEYCFQEVLKLLSERPIMLELGAYWAHYSMWLKKTNPMATCFMVEPDEQNIKVGKFNFELNNFDGFFINAFVSKSDFSVDNFITSKAITRLDILHSDIQGFELDMLDGAEISLRSQIIDWVFLSTHSQELHYSCIKKLEYFGYNILVSSCFEHGTTSYDGFILAISPKNMARF